MIPKRHPQNRMAQFGQPLLMTRAAMVDRDLSYPLRSQLVVFSERGLESHRVACQVEGGISKAVWAYTEMPILGGPRKKGPLPKVRFIFVMDMSGNLFVAFKDKRTGEYVHHSSLANLRSPFAAGYVTIRLSLGGSDSLELENTTGHYATPPARMPLVVNELERQGFGVIEYDESGATVLPVPPWRTTEDDLRGYRQVHGDKLTGRGGQAVPIRIPPGGWQV